jgi:nucleotide-binding universal stress UspA family protein
MASNASIPSASLALDEQQEQAAVDDAPRRSILVPVDLQRAGEVKIPVAEAYARAFEADVLLLHVLRHGTVDPANVLPTEAVARTYLDTLSAHLRGSGIHAESILRSGGNVAAAILQEALIRDVQLIVLGTNVRSTWSSAVIGSVADQVARAATCPVLLVHPRGHLGEQNELRCFHEDAERAGVLVQRSLGIRTIELARIVGSVNRCTELGRDFRPLARSRRKHDDDRLNSIRRLSESADEMPAIDVYKLGFGYYILDGHHRVAVALQNGQLHIDADVIEYVPVADERAPERFAARRVFERETGLKEVGAARSESYGILLAAIERYREEQGLSELSLSAMRWFGEVFRPLWQEIRARELIAGFPGDRSADLVARLAKWRDASAPGVDWREALDKFAEAHGLRGTVNSSSRNG